MSDTITHLLRITLEEDDPRPPGTIMVDTREFVRAAIFTHYANEDIERDGFTLARVDEDLHAEAELTLSEWSETDHDVDGVETHRYARLRADFYLDHDLARAAVLGAYSMAERTDIAPVLEVMRLHRNPVTGSWEPTREPELSAEHEHDWAVSTEGYDTDYEPDTPDGWVEQCVLCGQYRTVDS